ncbi:hypothetical protein ACUODJ_57820, partial [Escherichia sp. HC-CC]
VRRTPPPSAGRCRNPVPLYPKSPYSRRLFYKRNIIGNQVFTWAWRFKECLFDTELKAAQDYDIFLRMVVEYGDLGYSGKLA